MARKTVNSCLHIYNGISEKYWRLTEVNIPISFQSTKNDVIAFWKHFKSLISHEKFILNLKKNARFKLLSVI